MDATVQDNYINFTYDGRTNSKIIGFANNIMFRGQTHRSDKFHVANEIMAGSDVVLSGVDNPVKPNDVSNKYYVDSRPWKESVEVATSADIALYKLQTIDGRLVAQGSRVLVKNQTDSRSNGIYVASSGKWTRSDDMPNGLDASGSITIVTKGQRHANSLWILNGAQCVVGSCPLTWTKLDFENSLDSDIRDRCVNIETTVLTGVNDLAQEVQILQTSSSILDTRCNEFVMELKTLSTNFNDKVSCLVQDMSVSNVSLGDLKKSHDMSLKDFKNFTVSFDTSFFGLRTDHMKLATDHEKLLVDHEKLATETSKLATETTKLTSDMTRISSDTESAIFGLKSLELITKSNTERTDLFSNEILATNEIIQKIKVDFDVYQKEFDVYRGSSIAIFEKLETHISELDSIDINNKQVLMSRIDLLDKDYGSKFGLVSKEFGNKLYLISNDFKSKLDSFSNDVSVIRTDLSGNIKDTQTNYDLVCKLSEDSKILAKDIDLFKIKINSDLDNMTSEIRSGTDFIRSEVSDIKLEVSGLNNEVKFMKNDMDQSVSDFMVKIDAVASKNVFSDLVVETRAVIRGSLIIDCPLVSYGPIFAAGLIVSEAKQIALDSEDIVLRSRSYKTGSDHTEINSKVLNIESEKLTINGLDVLEILRNLRSYYGESEYEVTYNGLNYVSCLDLDEIVAPGSYIANIWFQNIHRVCSTFDLRVVVELESSETENSEETTSVIIKDLRDNVYTSGKLNSDIGSKTFNFKIDVPYSGKVYVEIKSGCDSVSRCMTEGTLRSIHLSRLV